MKGMEQDCIVEGDNTWALFLLCEFVTHKKMVTRMEVKKGGIIGCNNRVASGR
jgi:hypothetical protein